jgi:putative ABC transport system permease protein
MFRNYFTIFFRSQQKRTFYSAINMLCLTTGITFALLIGLFIRGELLVNKSLSDVDRLFLLESKTPSNDDRDFFSPCRLPAQSLEQYSDVFESYYRFRDRNITLSKGDKHFRIQSMIGDASFLNMFGFPVLAGDAESPLKKPNSIVITRKVANQLFADTNVVGQTLTVSTEQNGKQEYSITAVIENLDDKNSVSDFMNMDAQVFLSLENYKDFFPLFDPNSWNDFIISYIKLKPGVNRADAETAMNKIANEIVPQLNDEPRTYFLNPLSDFYLITSNGAVQKLIWSLTIIVILILVLAISNFINISIASSFTRAKEVGVRRVIGGLQSQVVAQFLLESCVISLASGVLSIVLYELLHSYFGELFGASLPSILDIEEYVWIIMGGSFLLIGFLAGIYPAIFQSLAKPVDSLKGKFKSVQSTIRFSRLLMGTQFLITVFIFIATVVVSSQISFSLEKDLGFDKSNVIVVNSVPRLWNEAGFAKMESAKKEFLQSPEIQAVSLSWGSPDGYFSPGGGKFYKAGSPAEKAVPYIIASGDEDFKNVFGLKLIAGSFLEEHSRQNRNSVVINETAQRVLNAQIGDQLIAINFGDSLFTIRGIVADFHSQSLHQKIFPMMMMQPRDYRAYRTFSFKLSVTSPQQSVEAVERAWKRVFPDEPFNYWFTDEQMKMMYTTELQMKKAASTATVLMLIIVVTGVLGLVSLSVSKRAKEIGIRKVLGASLRDILSLITKEYVFLMLISFIAAMPFAYLQATRWLESFAYRIHLSWWMFVLPGSLLLVFTVLLVIIQSYNSASTDPVKSLKCE